MLLSEHRFGIFGFVKRGDKGRIAVTFQIIIYATITGCILPGGRIAVAQDVSEFAEANSSQTSMDLITEILYEMRFGPKGSEPIATPENESIKQLLKLVGKSHENFKSTLSIALPYGQKVVDDLVKSGNKQIERERMLATRKAAVLILALGLAHLKDIDSSFEEVDKQVKANTDSVKKYGKRLKSAEDTLEEFRGFPTTFVQFFRSFGLTIYNLSFPLFIVAVFPISGVPMWWWLLKKIWWQMKKTIRKSDRGRN